MIFIHVILSTQNIHSVKVLRKRRNSGDLCHNLNIDVTVDVILQNSYVQQDMDLCVHAHKLAYVGNVLYQVCDNPS